jgi:hypothetical protein
MMIDRLLVVGVDLVCERKVLLTGIDKLNVKEVPIDT